jgi:uncharacterized membrane protein
MTSLIDPQDTWLVWSAVLAIAAFGLWSDSNKLGQILSGAVVSLLGGMVLSNLGLIPSEAPAYDAIYSYLLPLAIPLVLFQADLTKIIKEAGRLFIGFCAGAAGTVGGAMLAYWAYPLGEHSARVTAAFTAAYTGGTLNLVATAKAVGLDIGDMLAAAVAAGNLTVILYLVVLFMLKNSSRLERWLENSKATAERPATWAALSALNPAQLVYSLAISAFVCTAGFAVEDWSGTPGSAILSITLVSVVLATSFPRFFATLDCASALGFVLLQILFVAIGASASIHAVVQFGPALMLFAAIMLLVHFVVSLAAARLFSLHLDEALIASNACALGAPTAAAMALSFRREELVLPALLCGTFGYAVGNFVGLGVYGVIR